jgi:hypothetical protein
VLPKSARRSDTGSILLPAATERFVKLHYTVQFVQSDLRKRQLGLKQIPIRIQRVQKRIYTAAIADVGEPGPILERGHQQLLLNPPFPNSLMSD